MRSAASSVPFPATHAGQVPKCLTHSSRASCLHNLSASAPPPPNWGGWVWFSWYGFLPTITHHSPHLNKYACSLRRHAAVPQSRALSLLARFRSDGDRQLVAGSAHSLGAGRQQTGACHGRDMGCAVAVVVVGGHGMTLSHGNRVTDTTHMTRRQPCHAMPCARPSLSLKSLRAMPQAVGRAFRARTKRGTACCASELGCPRTSGACHVAAGR